MSPPRTTGVGSGLRTGLLSLLALLAAVAAPEGTEGQAPTLDAVDSLVTAGDYNAARGSLQQWWPARERSEVPASDMARALLLRARLASDPEPAEADYLAVVLGYPATDHAPEALLRLGQGLLATGDALRAVAYLDRLVADYPGRLQRQAGLLWLARANSAVRRPAAACSAARRGLQDARDPDLVAMLRIEAAAACSVEVATTSSSRPATTPAPEGGRVPEPREAVAPAAGDWAVQTGAFRQRTSADALMERLRRAGYSPRLVRVPANDLLRVRLGRFTTSGPATSLVARLREQGFEAVVVRNAREERQP